jgi:hypothetical protein
MGSYDKDPGWNFLRLPLDQLLKVGSHIGMLLLYSMKEGPIG